MTVRDARSPVPDAVEDPAPALPSIQPEPTGADIAECCEPVATTPLLSDGHDFAASGSDASERLFYFLVVCFLNQLQTLTLLGAPSVALDSSIWNTLLTNILHTDNTTGFKLRL